MLELEPPVHTRLRTLVNRAFVSRQIERLRPRVEALANELIDAFPAGEPFDLLPAYAAPLPITIIAEMLGVPVEMGPQLLDWSHKMVAMYTHGRTRETEVTANQATGEFSDFLRGYAKERRKNPGDDLLSLLISAQEDGQKLNEDELVSSTILLLNAGHEATVHQTGNAVRTILAQGGDPRRFFATPEATAATVEECLRYDAPLHMFMRYVYADTELRPGVHIKAGEQIGLLARHGEPRSERLRRAIDLRSRPCRPEERLLRRRHPFLHRRAAGAAGAAGVAEGAVRQAAGAEAGGGAAIPGHVAFSRAGAAIGERMKDQETSDFYAREAQAYTAQTKQFVSSQLAGFMARLSPGATVLELGCGSGRDSKVLITAGFNVTPTDGTPEMAAIAEKQLGRPVKVLLFDDIADVAAYDGVWAECLSAARAARTVGSDSPKRPQSASPQRHILRKLQDRRRRRPRSVRSLL